MVRDTNKHAKMGLLKNAVTQTYFGYFPQISAIDKGIQIPLGPGQYPIKNFLTKWTPLYLDAEKISKKLVIAQTRVSEKEKIRKDTQELWKKYGSDVAYGRGITVSFGDLRQILSLLAKEGSTLTTREYINGVLNANNQPRNANGEPDITSTHGYNISEVYTEDVPSYDAEGNVTGTLYKSESNRIYDLREKLAVAEKALKVLAEQLPHGIDPLITKTYHLNKEGKYKGPIGE